MEQDIWKPLVDEFRKEKESERKLFEDSHKIASVDRFYDDFKEGIHKCVACKEPFFLNCHKDKKTGSGWEIWNGMCPHCVVKFLNRYDIKPPKENDNG